MKDVVINALKAYENKIAYINGNDTIISQIQNICIIIFMFFNTIILIYFTDANIFLI